MRFARQHASNLSAVVKLQNERFTTKQLLIDVSVIYQIDAGTGIQRVVRALLLQLLHEPPVGYQVRPIFASRKRGYYYADLDFLKAPERAKNIESEPAKGQNGDIFLALDLAAHLLPRHQAQLLDWKRVGVKLHVLVYDLLPLLHPEWFTSKTTKNFKRWIRWVAIYSDSAICISQTVKTELRAWLNGRFLLPPNALSTSTIVLGADIQSSAPSDGLPKDAESLLHHMRTNTCVLMVGTLEPRKGHDQTLAAFEQLWKQTAQAPSLVLVGRGGWKTEHLQRKLHGHAEAGKRLFWLQGVSDEYLTYLYSTCFGVLVASRAEGFGLPLIEGALHGKPVLARDLSVFREMNLENITYFNGEDPQLLASSLAQWFNFSKSEIFQPDEISKKYSPTWRLATQQLLQALNLKHRQNFLNSQPEK